MSLRRHRPEEEADLNMSPMIDIVFLLLVFFLVTSKPQKPESDLGLKLPGTVEQEEVVDIPDEQRIEIQSNGQIVLNQLPMDAPDDPKLPRLTATLIRFKEATDRNKSEALVTIAPEDDVKHQRITDVLNACAYAGIDGVTFATESEEDSF